MRFGERASQLLESHQATIPVAPVGEHSAAVVDAQSYAINAINAKRVRLLRADGWVVCACGRDYYGCEGRPNECWLCRKQREGEPLNVADRMILARRPARQGQIGEVA